VLGRRRHRHDLFQHRYAIVRIGFCHHHQNGGRTQRIATYLVENGGIRGRVIRTLGIGKDLAKTLPCLALDHHEAPWTNDTVVRRPECRTQQHIELLGRRPRLRQTGNGQAGVQRSNGVHETSVMWAPLYPSRRQMPLYCFFLKSVPCNLHPVGSRNCHLMNAPAKNGHKKLNREDPQAKARRMSNYIRMLEFLVAAVIVIAGIQNKVYPFDYYLLVALLLGYPLIAQVIAALMERRGNLQQATANTLIQLDSIFIGIAIAVLQYAVVPAIALLIIANANAVTGGGLFLWVMNFVWLVIGAVIGSLIVGFQMMPMDDTPTSLTLVSLLGLGVYVAASSFNSHQQTKLVLETQGNLARQQRQAVELSRKLAKYLSPQIWGSLFSGRRDAKVETRRKKLTVFFSDIKGFSAMSEELPLEQLTRMLN